LGNLDIHHISQPGNPDPAFGFDPARARLPFWEYLQRVSFSKIWISNEYIIYCIMLRAFLNDPGGGFNLDGGGGVPGLEKGCWLAPSPWLGGPPPGGGMGSP